jgi:hypothetical protein
MLVAFLYPSSGGETLSIIKGDHLEYYNELKSYRDNLSSVINGLDGIQQRLSQLQLHYQNIKNNTNEVREECKSLLAQRDDLVGLADRLSVSLKYFEEAESLGRSTKVLASQCNFSSPDAPPLDAHQSRAMSQRILELLEQLEQCLAFMVRNSDFKDANKYRALFTRLRATVFMLLKSFLKHAFQSAVRVIQSEQDSEQKSDTPVEPGSGSSDLKAFVRLRSLAADVAPLIRDIQTRAEGEAAHQELLKELHDIYFKCRSDMLQDDTTMYLGFLSKRKDFSELCRASCNFLLQACTLENQLLECFFSKHPLSATLCDDVLGLMCGMVYKTVRPVAIHQTELDVLCEVVGILSDEVLARGQERNIPTFTTTIRRLLQDVQERLAYRAQMYIRDYISSFTPTAADLDYPNLLLLVAPPESSRVFSSSWYPTVELTLIYLSKIYRCVEATVFRYLAQEAIRVCVASLNAASELIRVKHAATSPQACDGLLFVVKHFLVLREQISPFQVDFAITEKVLDFSHIRDALPNLSSQLGGSIMRRSSWRQVLEAVRRTGPRVLENTTDSKRDLDKQLKEACETLIAAQTQNLIGSLLAFFNKVAKQMGSTTLAGPADRNELLVILRILTKSTPSHVAQTAVSPTATPTATPTASATASTTATAPTLVPAPDAPVSIPIAVTTPLITAAEPGTTVTTVENHLRSVLRDTALYVKNDTTEKILFQPILRTLSEVFEQLRFYVEHNFPESQVDNQELHRLVTVLEEVLHNVRLVE